jgi:hypothetical protein
MLCSGTIFIAEQNSRVFTHTVNHMASDRVTASCTSMLAFPVT